MPHGQMTLQDKKMNKLPKKVLKQIDEATNPNRKLGPIGITQPITLSFKQFDNQSNEVYLPVAWRKRYFYHDKGLYYNLGLVYYRQHKFDESITQFKKALELKPYFAEAQYNIGVAYDCANQPEKAIEAYNKVIKLMPNDAKLYFNIGLCEMKIGHYLEAKKKLNKAIQLDPLLTDAYHNLGYLAELEEDLQRAASFYEKVLSIEKTHKLANRNLKRVLLKKEKTIKKPTVSKRIPVPIQSSQSVRAD